MRTQKSGYARTAGGTQIRGEKKMSNQKSGGVWVDIADMKTESQLDSRNPDYCDFCGREKSLIAPRTRCTVCNSPSDPESIFGKPKIEDCPACDIEGTWDPNFKVQNFCVDCPRYLKRKLQFQSLF